MQILTHLHQYVPSVEYEEEESVPGTNESVTVQKAKMHKVMLGGDQLSKVRAVSAIRVKSNGETPSTRLEGFLPTVEDWHAKQCLFEVRYLATHIYQNNYNIITIIIGYLEIQHV